MSRYRRRGGGARPRLKITEEDDDEGRKRRRGGAHHTETKPPENYPVLEKTWEFSVLTDEQKDLVETMRRIDEHFAHSGYYLESHSGLSRSAAGTKRRRRDIAGTSSGGSNGTADSKATGLDAVSDRFLAEIPALSPLLFPKELLVGLKKLNEGSSSLDGSAAFFSAEFLSKSVEELTQLESDEPENDEEPEREHQAVIEEDEDGGDYDIGAHMDNDEDNVNAFGDDVNGVIGQ